MHARREYISILEKDHLSSTLAIQESTLCRPGKSGQAPSGNSMKSGEKVDITKLRSLPCPCHEALIWLPFSCYLVAGKMAKVEFQECREYLKLESTKCDGKETVLRFTPCLFG
jgi:hypothetical protein